MTMGTCEMTTERRAVGRPSFLIGSALLLAVGACASPDEPADASGARTPDGAAASSAASASDEETRTPLRERLPDLQAANDHQKFALAMEPSGELADNRIGVSLSGAVLDHPHLDDRVEDIRDLGAKRVHSYLNEVEPPIDWDVDEHDIPPEFDRFVDGLVASGVAFDHILHFWDKKGRALGETLSTPRFQDAQQVEDFVAYVRFIVRHFEGRVATYTVWSEPDNCGQEGGIKCVEAEDYIELARQVIPVIREEDPAAKVAIAPVVLFFEREFLPTILSSDVASMFDVIQWHGQYGVTPDDPFYRQHGYYEQYPSIVAEIKEIAEANGFRGEYWVTEMGWCSQENPTCHNPDHPWGTVASDKIAAKYYARGIVAHLGMDIAAGITHEQRPWIETTQRNLARVMAGATATDVAVELVGEDLTGPIQSFGFDVPGGERMIAVWSDGPAADDDPGVNTTVTLPDTSASRAVGIDVVHGFEQDLMIDSSGDDVVIRELLLKDHPTIIRLTP